MKCAACRHERLIFDPSPEQFQQHYRHYYIMSPYGSKGIVLCKTCYESFRLEEKFLREKFNLQEREIK